MPLIVTVAPFELALVRTGLFCSSLPPGSTSPASFGVTPSPTVALPANEIDAEPGAPSLPKIEFWVICAFPPVSATRTPPPVLPLMTLWLIVVVAVPPRTMMPDCSDPAPAALLLIVLPSIVIVPVAAGTSMPGERFPVMRFPCATVLPPMPLRFKPS